ncbi:MAG TPA: CoA transferase [Acidimicrobiia bacterium]|nr:CoA transferase [Acidimicrobiia bacterium]
MSHDEATERRALLDGIRVLDLSIWRPGPYATQLLADLGADVLKVEPPGGDPMRVFPQLFSSLNANKRSMVLDLKDPDQRAHAHTLVAEADVFVEGFRPGVADRLGVGEHEVRAINPSIVYCSISGYGQDGPLARTPGHDLNYQAYAGMLTATGGPPVESTVPVADLSGGVFAAMGICAALLGRATSGAGERIDVSMAEILATWTGPFTGAAVAGTDKPMGRLAAYGSFPTADGRWITLGLLDEQHFWEQLCDALDLPDVRSLDFRSRLDRHDELSERISAAIASRPLDDLVTALGDEVPVAPALTRAEMLRHPQHVHRQIVGLRTGDGTPTMGYPVRFSERPARSPGRPPSLGEQQEERFLPRPPVSGNP